MYFPRITPSTSVTATFTRSSAEERSSSRTFEVGLGFGRAYDGIRPDAAETPHALAVGQDERHRREVLAAARLDVVREGRDRVLDVRAFRGLREDAGEERARVGLAFGRDAAHRAVVGE